MLCLSELLRDLLSREGIILPMPTSEECASPSGGHGVCPLPCLSLSSSVSHLSRSDQLAALCPALDSLALSSLPGSGTTERQMSISRFDDHFVRPPSVYLIRPTNLVIRTMVEHTSAR